MLSHFWEMDYIARGLNPNHHGIQVGVATPIIARFFEECSSLQRIEIPDNVTRIGGHAFYGNISLEEVVISPDSKLQEIGSSAFRRCDSLREITLPRSTFVNGRAFKETPVRIDYYEY